MLSQIYKRVMITSGVIALGAILIESIIKSGVIKINFEYNLINALLGIALGMFLSIIRFKMLKDNIDKLVELDKEIAKKSGIIGYASRYILTAGVFIIAVLIDSSLVVFISLAITLILSTQIAARTVNIDSKKKGGGTIEGR